MSVMPAVSVGCAALLVVAGLQVASGPPVDPQVVPLSTKALERTPAVRRLIGTLRTQSDALVVLTGGPLPMSEAKQRELLAMFDALATLAAERRIVVGDGGTKGGVMEAAGKVRRASGRAFPLVGVAPAREIPPIGRTAIDPNHSHIVAVDDPSAPKGQPAWGSETAAMYWLFDRLASGASSVAIVASGGVVALDEIAANVEAGRPTILIEDSGGAADAMIALLRGTTPPDGEVASLQARAGRMRLARRPDIFVIVPMARGAAGLLEAMRKALGPVLPRSM